MEAMLEVKKGELVFIYNANVFRDREALGYAKSLKDFKIKEIDVSKEQLTEQQYMDLTYRLKIPPDDLFNKQSDVYHNEYAGVALSKTDILKAVKTTPSLLRTPIAVFEDTAYFVSSPYDFVKKGMRVEGVKKRMEEKNKDH